MRISQHRASHADHVDVLLADRKLGGRGIGDARRVEYRDAYFPLDRAGEAEIGRGWDPHRRPDPRLALEVGVLGADHADGVTEPAAGIGTRAGDAGFLAEAILQHLVARHADADHVIVPNFLAHRL